MTFIFFWESSFDNKWKGIETYGEFADGEFVDREFVDLLSMV